MTERQALNRAAREQRAEHELAERLQALSRPLAEKVLGRAIELDAEARREVEEAAATIDYDDLKDVALEVGISEEALRRAIFEQLDTDKDHNPRRLERVAAPDAVRGGVIVPGDVEEVSRHLATLVEALNAAGASPSTVVIGRPGARARHLHSTVVPQGGTANLVEVEVDTARVRRTGWTWIIAIAVLAMIFGQGLPFMAVLAGAVFLVGVTVWWVRTMVRLARRFVNKLLGAFFDKPSEEARGPAEWLDVWDRAREQLRG